MAPASLHSTHETVCVMDAAGPVGAAVAERLLQRGYTVHAATQGDQRELLKLLPSAGGGDAGKRLKVFWADPFDYQSLLDAMKGCSGLFYSFEPPPEQPGYDLWHALSKTLAEKTAWALAMDRDVNMVTINAGLLTGPGLSIANPYLKGAAEMYDDGVLVTVDDRFLADAHVCAFEDSASFGRYLCFNHAICCPEDAVEFAKMVAPTMPHPHPSDGQKTISQRIHCKKLNKLMLGFDSGLAKQAVH